MEYRLTSEELNVFTDIMYIFNSVLDIRLLCDGFLRQIGKMVPYEKAMVLTYSEEKMKFFRCADVRCDKSFIEDYINKQYVTDYMGWGMCQNKFSILRDSDALKDAKRIDTKFYQNFLKKNHLEHRLCFNCVSLNTNELLGVVHFFRSDLFEDFNVKELSIIKRIQHNLAASIEIARRFEQLTMENNIKTQAYNNISQGLILIDNDNNIKYINNIANAYLEDIKSKDIQGYFSFISTLDSCCKYLQYKYLKGKDSTNLEKEKFSFLNYSASVDLIKPHPLSQVDRVEFVVIITDSKDDSEDASNDTAIDNEKVIETGKQQISKEKLNNDSYVEFLDTLYDVYGFTKREIEIVSLALEGMTNSEISKILYISQSTVKSHFQNIYTKLPVRDRQELITICFSFINQKTLENGL